MYTTARNLLPECRVPWMRGSQSAGRGLACKPHSNNATKLEITVKAKRAQMANLNRRCVPLMMFCRKKQIELLTAQIASPAIQIANCAYFALVMR